MEKEGENLHKGHRSRLKARFIAEGLDSFSDHNVLEMILFYSIPQKDTNETAHKLLGRFKTLDGVFDASIDELEQVEGISEHSAVLIKLISETWKRYTLCARKKQYEYLDNSETAGKFAATLLAGQKNECFLVICLNARLAVQHYEILSNGTVNGAQVEVRRVAELALRKNSSSVIIAHNHPSGALEPSDDDVRITALIADALHTVGVDLNDHFICSGEEFLSMAQDTDLSMMFD